MKPYKYIYIDDIPNGQEQGVKNGIERGGLIEITFGQPSQWEKQIEELKKTISDHDGIILDLRLNDNPNSAGEYAKYRGSSVAQELRTLAKEKTIENDFPIILISADSKIAESLDPTSLDLFDACISKNTLGADEEHSYEDFIKRLVALASGYKTLNDSQKTLNVILGLENELILDIRFLDKFKNHFSQPIHIIARFIIKQVLEKPTFLINEDYLSARLGISTKSPDWNKFLKEIISKYKYTGVFSEYYERWWMPLIENWWESEVSSEFSLRTITSTKRVELLKNKFSLNLLAIDKMEKANSESFWTICKVRRSAIDSLDGFVVANQDDIFPWQEKEYVSIEEALRPLKIDIWKDVAVLEKKRLQNLKTLYGKAEQRNK